MRRLHKALNTPERLVVLRDGTSVTIRAIKPSDAEIEKKFVRGLSAQSKYRRFFSAIKELPQSLLKRFTHPHYPDSYALIATVEDGDEVKQVGVARYSLVEKEYCAEFAVVIADEQQGLGIATYLLNELADVARSANIQHLQGVILRENVPMLRLAKKLGFIVEPRSDDASTVRVVKSLAHTTKTDNGATLP